MGVPWGVEGRDMFRRFGYPTPYGSVTYGNVSMAVGRLAARAPGLRVPSDT
ncbi:hypothetical protein GCM10010524_39050 [Streptomyces mexicanus]